jgi:hypothetical protein
VPSFRTVAPTRERSETNRNLLSHQSRYTPLRLGPHGSLANPAEILYNLGFAQLVRKDSGEQSHGTSL